MHGRHQLVRLPDGSTRRTVTRGRRSDCVVGDFVETAVLNGEQAVIDRVLPRRNLVQRADDWHVRQLAANVDQAIVVISAHPHYDEAILLRVLIALEAAGVPASVVATKSDLPEHERIASRLQVLRRLDYPVIETAATDAVPSGATSSRAPSSRAPSSGAPSRASAGGGAVSPDAADHGAAGSARRRLRPADLDTLHRMLDGRLTLLLGESGMGKSTLINALTDDARQRTGEISAALGAGRHTTTFSCAFALDTHDAAAGWIIDTPGFQAFSVAHLGNWEVAHAMRDVAPYIGQCRFNNCMHGTEPGCAVRAAAEHGRIDPLRYRLYADLVTQRGR